MSDTKLRSSIIRLAHTNPELRPHLLPLLTKTAADKFTQAYLEAALATSTDDDGDPLDREYNVNDIADDTRRKMEQDCKKFQRDNDDAIRGRAEEAGTDFWLTRNGTGSGFWDGDWDDAGDALSDSAKDFGEFNLYIGDDGELHGG